MKSRKDSLDLAFHDAAIIRPGLDKKLGEASDNLINGRVAVASDADATHLEAFDIRMDDVGSLYMQGTFELPESQDQWASLLIHRLGIEIHDYGMMQRQAEATREMLAESASLEDAYAELYYQAEQGLGANQDLWPINARLYLMALAAQAYPDMDQVEIELTPDQPLSIGELINHMITGKPLPVLVLDVPEPGTR